ncbi:flagellar brake protein [Thalassotalea euphylliae]|uniref:flagellar brake protein n=1 Tax=Thalassotalea euphylliae TaxID=1655234 RepID=UPI003632E67E
MSLSAEKVDTFFELTPGKAMDIQLTHPVNTRLKALLVGYEIGKYILVRPPEITTASGLKNILVEGNIVIVRYIVEGTTGKCYAFKAAIKHITKHPHTLLFLDYPQKIESRELRTHQRFTTHIPASIWSTTNRQEGQHRIEGIISDISASGCGFSFQTENEKLKVNKTDVMISLALREDEKIEIPALVCNSRFEQGKVFVGIKFNEADKQVEKILEHLLIDQAF